MSKLRFVFDTNTIVSALLLKNSTPRKAFKRAFEIGEILLSFAVIEELNDVFGRKKFNKYIQEQERIQFLVAFVQDATLIEISKQITICRDPKDDKFLELAVSGNATCIISGDQDVLVMNPFEKIPILTPREFLETKWGE